jgi:hypothetical protein
MFQATDPQAQRDKLIQELSSLQDSGNFKLDFTNKADFLEDIKQVGGSIKTHINPIDFGTAVKDTAFALDSLAAQMANKFGVAKSETENIKNTIALSYKDIFAMGGDYTDIVKQQQAVTDSLHTNIIATSDNVKDLFATSKITNVAPDKLIEGFRSVGLSMSHIKGEMENVVNYASSVGVNVDEVSKKFVENLSKANLYSFQNGTEGLTKMAAQATMLNIDMSKAFAKAEEMLDPQKAIDLSASLQRLGVTSSQLLDPLRAMDIAQNDPAELQNQMIEISKEFVKRKEDGTFDIIDKRRLREVAKEFNMTGEQFASLAKDAAILQDKMSKITFPDGLNANEEQKTLIANLSQFNEKTGKYEISLGLDESGAEIKKSIDQLPTNNKELNKMLEKATSQKEKPKMESLAEQQLSVLKKILGEKKIISESGVVEAAVKGGDTITRTYSKAFEDMRKKMVGEKKDFTTKSQEGIKGKKILSEGDLNEKIENKGHLGTMMEAGSELFTNYLTKNVTAITGAANILVTELTKIGEVLPLDETQQKNLAKTSKSVTKFLDEISTAAKNVDPEILQTFIKDKFKDVKMKMTENFDIKTIFEGLDILNDFIITKEGIHKYNEGDIMIGGTNLDGENNKSIKNIDNNQDIIKNNNITKEEKPLSTINNPEQSLKDPLMLINEINRNSVETIKNTQGMLMESLKISSNNTKNYDFKPLTSIIEQSFSGLKLDSQKNINKNNFIDKLSTSNITPKTPVYNVSQPQLQPINLPEINSIETKGTHKHEFGKLEIEVKIPNIPAGLSTEQIQNVLETTMRSTDFQQSLVIATNNANTNFGQTSKGGTAGSGPNRRKYS